MEITSKNAKSAKVEFNRALHMYPVKESGWQPKVLLASALKNEGISEIWELIDTYLKEVKHNNSFDKNRKEKNKYWLIQSIEDRLTSDLYNNPTITKELQNQLHLI